MTYRKAIELTEELLEGIDTDEPEGVEMYKALEIAIAALKEKADRVKCGECRCYTEDGTCDLLNNLRFGPDDFCSYGEPKENINRDNCNDCDNRDAFCFYCSRNYEDMYKQKEER